MYPNCTRREFLKLGGTTLSYPLTRPIACSIIASGTVASSNSFAARICGPATVDSTFFTIDSTLVTVSNNAETRDSDCDGLSNNQEIRTHNTNPLKADTDNDGLNDRDEIAKHSTNPLNPDSDSDTFTDSYEVAASSDPLDPDSTPYPLVADGDINLDGKVDAGDIVLTENILINNLPISTEQLQHIDIAPLINGVPSPDGKLTLGDLIVLTRKVLGQTSF